MLFQRKTRIQNDVSQPEQIAYLGTTSSIPQSIQLQKWDLEDQVLQAILSVYGGIHLNVNRHQTHINLYTWIWLSDHRSLCMKMYIRYTLMFTQRCRSDTHYCLHTKMYIRHTLMFTHEDVYQTHINVYTQRCTSDTR